MSSNKVKRLSKTITKEEIIIEEINEKPREKPGEVFKIEQRNKSPEPNNKCCGLFSCCSSHTTINGNNNSVNTDKTIDTKADLNIGINK